MFRRVLVPPLLLLLLLLPLLVVPGVGRPGPDHHVAHVACERLSPDLFSRL